MNTGDPHPLGGVYVEGLSKLSDLINKGINSQGIFYSCGCTASAWTKEKRLLSVYKVWCDEHQLEGGPMTRN